MPALDGSALTGGGTAYTENASDPAITTNPSGGVGTFWVNTTSGETFCLTDATSNANIWVNIGGGSGDYGKAFGGSGPGTIAGFASGGYTPTVVNTIDKFTFGSSNNATDHGDLTLQRFANAGCSSATNGYTAGGDSGGGSYENTIDKFAFASTGNATDVGDLTAGVGYTNGSSSVSHGFANSGINATVGQSGSNVINKFSFSADGNATDHGDLTTANYGAGGSSSNTHGYTSGGHTAPGGSPTNLNRIEKYSFAVSATSVDHGDLTITSQAYGLSSSTHGFAINNTMIDKFAFSSNVTAVDIGDLSVTRYLVSGASSTTHGYGVGGRSPYTDTIDKFSFSQTSGTAADHGNLTVARAGVAATQY